MRHINCSHFLPYIACRPHCCNPLCSTCDSSLSTAEKTIYTILFCALVQLPMMMGCEWVKDIRTFNCCHKPLDTVIKQPPSLQRCCSCVWHICLLHTHRIEQISQLRKWQRVAYAYAITVAILYLYCRSHMPRLSNKTF